MEERLRRMQELLQLSCKSGAISPDALKELL
jgi:hypothetical protein